MEIDLLRKRRPVAKHNRIILHFDYDCFYASVFEKKDPSLKTKPLGVRQKGILATCNYVARRRGVKKLMSAAEASRICPGIVLVDGEDLSPFRDASKDMWAFFRSYSWNQKVERLGFDEVFMDVTDIVDYNLQFLNKATLPESFFCLSAHDPELGFECDLTAVAGCVEGRGRHPDEIDPDDAACMRLVLGSHLAWYLRRRLEEELGFTSTCGIATNKLLSKLVGSRNKPRNQTTLLLSVRGGGGGGDEGGDDHDAILSFMDGHAVDRIPGIGSKISHLLERHVKFPRTAEDASGRSSGSGEVAAASSSAASPPPPLTARDVRLHPKVSPGSLDTLLGGPGAERAVGAKIWAFLHGVDPTEVKRATTDAPTQISVEDTYSKGGGLDDPDQITAELHKLTASLLRRMRADLLVPAPVRQKQHQHQQHQQHQHQHQQQDQRWIARPRTIRLAISPRPQEEQAGDPHRQTWARSSKSQPLPSFALDGAAPVQEIASRLVSEAVLPLLRRLRPDRPPGKTWSLTLINVAVTNMTLTAADEKGSVGRDISHMFGGGGGGGGGSSSTRTRTSTSTPASASNPAREPGVIVRPSQRSRTSADEETGADGDDDDDDPLSPLFSPILSPLLSPPLRSPLRSPLPALLLPSPDPETFAGGLWDREPGVQRCAVCGHAIPPFAELAHARFHALADGDGHD